MKTIQYYRCSLSPFQALKLFLWCFVNVCFAWKVSWRPGHESEWSENVIRGRLGPGLLHIDLTRWGHGNSESGQVHIEITVRRIRDSETDNRLGSRKTYIQKDKTFIFFISLLLVLVGYYLRVSHVLIVDLYWAPPIIFWVICIWDLGDTRQRIVFSNWMKVITFDNLPLVDIKYCQPPARRDIGTQYQVDQEF